MFLMRFGVDAGLAEEIVQGLAVRPSLHQTCRDAGKDAHVGPEPFHTLLGLSSYEAVDHLAVELAPSEQQITVFDSAEPSVGGVEVARGIAA